jgi:hypothetical protein
MTEHTDSALVFQRFEATRPPCTLPERVRVMGIDYTVMQVPNLAVGEKTVDGRAYLDQGLIMVRAEMGATLQLQTLWHEIVHAIGYIGRINSKKVGSEEAVDYLAWALLQVVRDNPDLVKGGP